MSVVVSLEDVTFSYSGPKVLDKVSLEVRENEFLGLVGPNAGGKSTLLKIMLGLLKPLAGRVRVLGEKPEKSCTQVGYVPQYPLFSREFPITVEQTVLMGRLGVSGLFGGYRRRDREVAQRAMLETEIINLASRQLCTLSGGQLQRVLMARALACEPRILMLDEPTANIDMRIETEIFDLLKKLSRRMTIIVVSHDVGFISGYVGRVACLNRTLVCHPTASIDGDTIRSLYQADVKMVEHHHH
ncbi:MAG: ABC transporter ATP-binding protein [Sedimenticola sp.]|uniref:ABC transporter ATP-binding protein n=1 Tax=Sedimenticola thiotaurini TaxID=1543721 RepID=A0A558DAC9_9GAMM|nr:ABC transporter ATP-binding protein [Sedimenticola sp.]TVT57987.1 MAG: ABC transporter ATP-binding protein [Sedimenticola thiotaurini]MCW8947260.1 ABC transporter ATP-binding protein [Sedimenticola sp.]MCW8948802.1 ABC transporter ATP-binding protein [Sedimenticola sp.]MCW8974763.1 ABC transporter ATP-binding protein [Sedimenticola sp.]